MIAASILIAFLSWRFVERPFRERRILKKQSSVFAFGLATILAVLMPSIAIARLRGFPERLDPRYYRMIEDISSYGQRFEMKDGKGIPIGIPGTGDPRDDIDFAVFGDSHAMALGELLDGQAKRFGLRGVAYLRSGAAPVEGVWRVRDEPNAAQSDMRATEAILGEIARGKARHLFLIGRWSICCEGYGKNEIFAIKSAGAMGPAVIDSPGGEISPERSSEVLRVHMAAMLKRLSGAGIETWLIEQVPESDQPRVAHDFYLAKRYPFLNSFERESTSFEEHRARQARADAVLGSMASATVHVVDPTPSFFPGDSGNLALYGERAYYRDDDHLTEYGADTFMEPVLKPIFERIAAEKAAAGTVGR